jgi:hypothetical protein
MTSIQPGAIMTRYQFKGRSKGHFTHQVVLLRGGGVGYSVNAATLSFYADAYEAERYLAVVSSRQLNYLAPISDQSTCGDNLATLSASHRNAGQIMQNLK